MRVLNKVCFFVLLTLIIFLCTDLLLVRSSQTDVSANAFSVGKLASINRAPNNPLVPQETCPPGTPTRIPTPLFTPAPNCLDAPRTSGVLRANIVDHQETTEGIFSNTSNACSYRIGLANYRMFNEDIEDQEIFDYRVAIISPNSTLALTVNNPTCAYQGDAFYGDVIFSFAGGALYNERRLDDTDGVHSIYCTVSCSGTPIVTGTPENTGTPSPNTNTPTHTRTRTPAITRSPLATQTVVPTRTPAGNAFLEFVPEDGAPPNGGTVNLGDRFVLDLMLNAGSSAPPDGVTAQQSYLTFTYDLIKNVRSDQIATACALTSTATVDQTSFDTSLQNEICNGPEECLFRGRPVDAGSFAFASGALTTCFEGCGGVFRVAQVGLCAVAPGRALLHWQFTPPAPVARDTEIIVASGDIVSDRTLFTDYVINIANQTSTPTVTSTPARLVVGHVNWQGRPPQPSTRQQVPISLSLSLESTSVNYLGVNTDANGYFTVTTGSLPSGRYTWRIKGYDPQRGGPAFLANSGTVDLAGIATSRVEMDLMKAGDANNDNYITALDFIILKNTFGRPCSPCPDPRADFNGDSLISISDFSLLKLNFGQAGAP